MTLLFLRSGTWRKAPGTLAYSGSFFRSWKVRNWSHELYCLSPDWALPSSAFWVYRRELGIYADPLGKQPSCLTDPEGCYGVIACHWVYLSWVFVLSSRELTFDLLEIECKEARDVCSLKCEIGDIRYCLVKSNKFGDGPPAVRSEPEDLGKSCECDSSPNCANRKTYAHFDKPWRGILW